MLWNLAIYREVSLLALRLMVAAVLVERAGPCARPQGARGEKASGWHYDLLLVAINFVPLTVGGGRLVIG